MTERRYRQAQLLTVEQMARADAATIAGGIPGIDLMEAAGRAVADAARAEAAAAGISEVRVLCGPGNNGGDGFVAARLLAEAGMSVRLALLGSLDNLRGDAALAADAWTGMAGAAVEPLTTGFVAGGPFVAVDALFGAGLARPIEGAAAEVVEALNDGRTAGGVRVVAVDVPSGVFGTSGAVAGSAVSADRTVTFCRRKPGHFLLPGAARCGRVTVADIGIPDDVVGAIVAADGAPTWVDSAELWWDGFPRPAPAANKYGRGHLVIWGGAGMPGAAHLAAIGARRIGAGLVTIASAPEGADTFRAGDPGMLVAACADLEAYRAYIADARRNVLLVGPGAGLGPATRDLVLAALATERAVVLDADGLSAFADDPEVLFEAVRGPCVMTPHEGEFRRLFDVEGSKLDRARAAAARAGAVVLLKGFDTVVAAPDGRAAINANGSPFLATAGSGDVLAGMIAGLMGQGMDAFDAALAATWFHGAAGRLLGHGMIAEDIPAALPVLLQAMARNFDGLEMGMIFAPGPLAPPPDKVQS